MPRAMEQIDWDAAGAAAAEGDWVSLREALTGSRRARPGASAVAAEVRQLLDRALERAAAEGDVEALFVELDHTGRWAVYLCHSYLPDDDWPADFTIALDGPAVAPAHHGTGDLPLHELHEVAGILFPALGKVLRQRRLPLPVAMGVHDGPVLYPWVPEGALQPEEVPKTHVPESFEGFFVLVPVRSDAMRMSGVETALDSRQEGAWRQWQTYRRGRLSDSSGVVRARLTRGEPDDVLHVGTVGGPWLISERLRDALLDACAGEEGLEAIRFAVEDRKGVKHPYFLARPSVALAPLDPRGPSVSAQFRGPSTIRGTLLEGSHVVDVEPTHFRTWSAAIVSGAALRLLVERGCLVGLAAKQFTDRG